MHQGWLARIDHQLLLMGTCRSSRRHVHPCGNRFMALEIADLHSLRGSAVRCIISMVPSIQGVYHPGAWRQ